eukprot:5232669-Pyramimonas_sp.AAC.1
MGQRRRDSVSCEKVSAKKLDDREKCEGDCGDGLGCLRVGGPDLLRGGCSSDVCYDVEASMSNAR